ncbi:DUF6297 family protein [Streptomyces sp. NPDC052051]|uniref:DUF6297 family protein n=1 Tax=Streptomyces sp. NPDC052051 TaxID=3154649 RepID=UPI003437F49F
MSRSRGAVMSRRGSEPRASETAEGTAEEALRFLRGARGSAREERRRSIWFVLYMVVLGGAFWGIPALIAWSHSTQSLAPADRMSAQTSDVLPALVPTVLLLILLLAARGAMWRGPVVLDSATTHLLLPSRVSRRALLLPRLRASAALATVVGAAVGAVAGFLLKDLSTRPWAVPVVAGAVTGVSVALVSCALGVSVERHAGALARRAGTLFAAGWLLTALAAVGTAMAWRGYETYGLAQALLWSGPWGWAAQPLLWALGVVGPQAAAGTALAVCAPALGLLLGVRELPDIPQSALRLRATVAAQVGASVLMLDFRQARSGVPALRERSSSRVLRLPMPRRRALLVPWRDLSCLLRHPRRLGWALVWTVLAVVAMRVAPSLAASPQEITVAVSLLTLYLGAAQLTEPARLESDDARRSTNLSWTFRTLALLHALVPLTLLLAGTSVGVAVGALGGAPTGGGAPLLACVPALVAAALVSSYRGVMPIHLTIGVDTPMGNTGPWQAAAWYARGPLVVISLLFPVCLMAARGHPWSIPQMSWQLAVAAAGMWWVRYTAHRLHTK